jgi:hypothetical protein
MRFRILAALFAVIVAARGIRADPAADTALVREIERRAALDFTVTSEDLLAELRESIPDVSQDDVATWTESGALLSRTIDGKLRYFRSAAANLFRVNADARKRRVHAPPAKKRFALKALLHELVDQAETSPTPEIYPVKHRVRYSLAVNEGHPLVKPGAKVRLAAVSAGVSSTARRSADQFRTVRRSGRFGIGAAAHGLLRANPRF